jgi:signal transduction histidine kinase
VVDGCKTVTITLKKLIDSQNDLKCDIAYDFNETKYLLSKGIKYEVAILDLDLPDAHHGEVVDLILSYKIPVVVFTGILDEKTEETFRKKNIVDYVLRGDNFSYEYAVSIAKRVINNKNIKALLVDDSKLMHKFIIPMLEDFQLSCISAYDGEEAYQILKEQPDIKLVITDYEMPNINGLELTRKIRLEHPKSTLAILVLTSNTTSGLRTKFIKSGANGFMHKGFSRDDLFLSVTDALNLIESFSEVIRQEKQIQDQLRATQMNELMGNIAHQWRQPLSSITTAASGMKLHRELGMLNDNMIERYIEGINSNANNLSKIIDLFTVIVNKEKEMKDVIVQTCINRALLIINPTLEETGIKLINNVDYEHPQKLTMVSGELTQVIINIFNNAIDVLTQRGIEEKIIVLDMKTLEDKVVITIEDNAGGVDEKVLPKIFDPYFTSKHQSQGAGLGLHICYDIVINSLHGNLYVQNSDNGARFYIELPIK